MAGSHWVHVEAGLLRLAVPPGVWRGGGKLLHGSHWLLEDGRLADGDVRCRKAGCRKVGSRMRPESCRFRLRAIHLDRTHDIEMAKLQEVTGGGSKSNAPLSGYGGFSFCRNIHMQSSCIRSQACIVRMSHLGYHKHANSKHLAF